MAAGLRVHYRNIQIKSNSLGSYTLMDFATSPYRKSNMYNITRLVRGSSLYVILTYKDGPSTKRIKDCIMAVDSNETEIAN